MHQHKIELTAGMSLEIIGKGDLNIRGQDEPVLLVKVGEPSDVTVQQEEGKVILHLESDAHLHLGPDVPLTIKQLAGDLVGRDLKGALEVLHVNGDVSLNGAGEVILHNVDGDVTISRAGAVQSPGYLDDDVVLRQVGAVDLEEIGGDLVVREATSLAVERAGDDVSASAIAGAVRFNQVRGDAVLHDIGGALEIGRVRGDLGLRNLRGDILVTRADSGINMRLAFQEGRVYRLTSRRAITVRFSQETAARFVIQAPRWTYPQEGLQVETEEEGRIVLCIGEGGPDVHLIAGGAVSLGASSVDWEQSVEEVTQRMEQWGQEFGQRMEGWGKQMRRQMEQADWQRFGHEIEEATARVSRLVETRLQEIDLEQLGRKASQAADWVEEGLASVDWERISEQVDRAVDQGMSQAQTGLERVQERLRRREERLQEQDERLQEKDLQRQERLREKQERLREKDIERQERLQEKQERLREKQDRLREKRATATAGLVQTVVVIEEAPVEIVKAPVEIVKVHVEMAEEAPAAANDLTEEHMAVLRLVEEGRLTAEEAGALLDALEE